MSEPQTHRVKRELGPRAAFSVAPGFRFMK